MRSWKGSGMFQRLEVPSSSVRTTRRRERDGPVSGEDSHELLVRLERSAECELDIEVFEIGKIRREG